MIIMNEWNCEKKDMKKFMTKLSQLLLFWWESFSKGIFVQIFIIRATKWFKCEKRVWNSFMCLYMKYCYYMFSNIAVCFFFFSFLTIGTIFALQRKFEWNFVIKYENYLLPKMWNKWNSVKRKFLFDLVRSNLNFEGVNFGRKQWLIFGEF